MYVLYLQLIGGLADEKVRWAESVKSADKMLVNVIGDVMVASGAVSYLGAFTVRNIVYCVLATVHEIFKPQDSQSNTTQCKCNSPKTVIFKEK